MSFPQAIMQLVINDKMVTIEVRNTDQYMVPAENWSYRVTKTFKVIHDDPNTAMIEKN